MEGRTRLAIYYVVLVLITAGVVTLVLSAGSDDKSQPGIAGGYDVTGPGVACLGPKVDVLQSGQFVSLDNGPSSISGELRFKSPKLTGTVDCVGSAKAQ